MPLPVVGGIAAWLFTLIAPFIVRGMAVLGFVATTFTGVAVIANELVSSAQATWSGLPVDVLALAAIAGVPEALGLILGAYVAVFGVKASMGASRFILRR